MVQHVIASANLPRPRADERVRLESTDYKMTLKNRYSVQLYILNCNYNLKCFHHMRNMTIRNEFV